MIISKTITFTPINFIPESFSLCCSYLLTIYEKSELENLSSKEIQEFFELVQ
jgi:hypothetical protein